MTTSAAPCPERRNSIVVYSMICTQQVRGARDSCHGKQPVSPFYRTTHVSSKWPLHFCHHSFRPFARLFIKLAMRIRALFSKPATTLGLVEQAFWRVPLFTEWIGASSFEVILAGPSKHSSTGPFPLGLRVFDAFFSSCCMKEFGDGFGCVIFARLLKSWRKLQLSPLEHCPLASHSQQSPRLLCSRCFILWFLTTALVSIFPFLASKKFFILKFCSILLFTIVFNLWSSGPAFFWWIYILYNSNTVFNFSDSPILNLYNPSKISSDGIFVIDNRIPSHFETNSWISSFRRPIVNRSA